MKRVREACGRGLFPQRRRREKKKEEGRGGISQWLFFLQGEVARPSASRRRRGLRQPPLGSKKQGLPSGWTRAAEPKVSPSALAAIWGKQNPSPEFPPLLKIGRRPHGSVLFFFFPLLTAFIFQLTFFCFSPPISSFSPQCFHTRFFFI